MTNALEQLLYEPVTFQEMKGNSQSYIPYERGMSITLNNTKTHAHELFTSMKDIYQSIYKALTNSKISKDDILTSIGKVPNRRTIMDMVINDQPIMVGAIHKYRDMKFDEFHLHLYVYGVHHYLQEDDGKIRFQKLRSYLQRYLKSKRKRSHDAIDIREVGINSNKFNDVITPATVHEYLEMPLKNPEKDSWINYLAETRRQTEYKTPLYYFYQKF